MEQYTVHVPFVASPLQKTGGDVPRLDKNARNSWLDGLSITTFSSFEEADADWQYLEKFASVPFADRVWAQAWYRAHAEDSNTHPVIVVGRAEDGTPLFLLPLVCERRGPFKVLAWPGGYHSPYQCGLFSPDCYRSEIADNAETFWGKIFASLGDYDALAAYGLPSFEIQKKNPLSWLPLLESGCPSYRLALREDWDELYQTKINAKMRSNDRRCERRISEQGALRFRVAKTREERRQMLATLIEQKSARFREQGIPDFFSKPTLRAFYEKLAESDDWNAGRSLFISALELDGEVITVNLGIIHDGTFYGMILSMAAGEIERFGPGRILLRRSMEYLCRDGIKVFDFGVGEDHYKDIWYEEKIDRSDVLVSLNTKGWLFISGLKLCLKSKAYIKNSPRLWLLFGSYRKYLGC